MPPPTKADNKRRARAQRRARLAAELRSNLKKRKEQARGRELNNAPDAAETKPARGEQEDQPNAREAATRSTGEVA
ncbi:MAG: hypothetical protein J2P50_00820 [Hyphomicrobiaceae bacterium]|nr:hypothetical protein [Hyphomicrobiaceae bacterium]